MSDDLDARRTSFGSCDDRGTARGTWPELMIEMTPETKAGRGPARGWSRRRCPAWSPPMSGSMPRRALPDEIPAELIDRDDGPDAFGSRVAHPSPAAAPRL